MKKYLTFNNALFLIGLSYLLYTSIPLMLNNISLEGKTISSREYPVLEKSKSDRTIIFPDKDRSIAIFWATWCAPCKLEMNRLSRSVENGKIPAGKIFAINPFESPETVKEFLSKNTYPFTFIEDIEVSRLLNISRTPTTLFIEKEQVRSISSGLSLIGIWKAESFL